MRLGTLACLAAFALPPMCYGGDLKQKATNLDTVSTQTAGSFRPSPASTAPAPAAAVGYTVRTFGPAVTPERNWWKWADNPGAVRVSQNGDGSVTVSGGGNSYNAQLMTAVQVTGPLQPWRGTAFSGGGYFEATLSFTGGYSKKGGWPAFWANDVESYWYSGERAHWQGQMPGYKNDIETDFMEFDTGPNSYGGGMHNWYSSVPGTEVSTTSNQPFVLPDGTDPSKPHKYGFLWVPATARSKGYVEFYFDGIHITNWDKSWKQYNPALPPAPVDGSSAYSVLDARHLTLILGTGPNNPMTVYGVEVWQASADRNLERPKDYKHP